MVSSSTDYKAPLPIDAVIDDITDSFKHHTVTFVSAPVGSGKQIRIPIKCMEVIDEPIYVIEFSQFYTRIGYESVKKELHDSDGVVVGQYTENRKVKSSVSDSNKLIFISLADALSTDIIRSAKNIIINNTQIDKIELSIAKAILRDRIIKGESIRILFSSSFEDEEIIKNSWDGYDYTFHKVTVENNPVTYIHNFVNDIPGAVLDLVETYGKRGILVFVAGRHDVQSAVMGIKNTLKKSGRIVDVDYEISSIYGKMPEHEKEKILGRPERHVKILVGTGLLELNLNMNWVDGGVSSGDTAVKHVDGFHKKLINRSLPRWRIHQQMAQCGRYHPGVYILTGKKDIEQRSPVDVKDTIRLPAEETVLRISQYTKTNPLAMNFCPSEKPDSDKVDKALNFLTLFEFLYRDEEDNIHQTYTYHLAMKGSPLGFRAAAALNEAYNLGEVARLLPLIAMIEIGDIRFNYHTHFAYSEHVASDMISQIYSVVHMVKHHIEHNVPLSDIAPTYNVNLKKYHEYVKVVRSLESFTGAQCDLSGYTTFDLDIILRSKIVLFSARRDMVFNISGKTIVSRMNDYPNFTAGNKSTCFGYLVKGGCDDHIGTGTPRIITPKEGSPFTILTDMTLYSPNDINKLVLWFGEEVVFRDITKPSHCSNDTAIESKSESKIGSFGEILKEAMIKAL